MNAKVVLNPRALQAVDVVGRTVVVFDVLRATTTMTVALACGVAEIRVFENIEAARGAAASYSGTKLLCGEVGSLPPAGFDLGNSPRDWNAGMADGRTVFLATTNGTRAMAAASAIGRPGRLLVAALVNARAAAAVVAAQGADVTLLCSGTAGGDSLDDVYGAGAVLSALAEIGPLTLEGASAQMARNMFAAVRNDLPVVMRQGASGRNLIGSGLEGDIDACARLDSLKNVGFIEVDGGGLACRAVRF